MARKSGSKDCFSQLLNNPPQIFSISDTEAEQIERTSIQYSHGQMPPKLALNDWIESQHTP